MTEKEIEVALADAARDLAADLGEILRHQPTWRISLLWEGQTNYAWPDYQRWNNRLPLVAALAIKRAMAAEAEAEELRAMVEVIIDNVRDVFESPDVAAIYRGQLDRIRARRETRR